MMRIDCHLHTSRYSECSRLNPDTACRLALDRGLNAVVITEHQRQWPPDELEALRRRFPGLALYNGLEATLDNGVDVIVITENHGIEVPVGLSREEFFASKWFDVKTSFLFIAHLYRWSSEPPHRLGEMAPFLHGLEMSSFNILDGQFQRDNGLYTPLARDSYRQTRDRFGLQGLFNSDAHDATAVGCIANEIQSAHAPASEAELASLLKRATPKEYQDPELLQELLSP